jgi:hypothetical protein
MRLLLRMSGVGFRQFRPLPSTGAGLAPERLTAAAAQCGNQEAAGAWARRPARKKGCPPIESFNRIDILGKDADLTNERPRARETPISAWGRQTVVSKSRANTRRLLA